MLACVAYRAESALPPEPARVTATGSIGGTTGVSVHQSTRYARPSLRKLRYGWDGAARRQCEAPPDRQAGVSCAYPEQPGVRCDLSRPEASWLSYDGAEYAIVPDLRITSTASVAVSKGAIVYR